MRGDRQLVSVVLGAEKITLADGKSTLTKSFSETIRLFDYGFDSFSRREVVSADELVREVPVALSSEANYVVAHPAESITRMLPTELDLSELTRDITLPDSVDAPIAAGDELGEMTVSYNGTVYGTVKLLALSDVSASWLLGARRDVADFFSRLNSLPSPMLSACGRDNRRERRVRCCACRSAVRARSRAGKACVG